MRTVGIAHTVGMPAPPSSVPAERLDADATRAHWDEQAAGYDAAKARNDVYYGTLKALVDRWTPADRRGRVLDVGCGTGQILAALGPGRGLGIDASGAMIERARATFAGRGELDFRTADAARLEDLPGHGEFDAVVSCDLLEHVPAWEAVVDACARAVRPGGRIVLTTPSPRWALPLWVLETLRLKMPEGPHVFVPLRAIRRRLEAAGARILHAQTHLALPARLLGAGPAVSRGLAGLPLGRSLGVIQLVVAETSA